MERSKKGLYIIIVKQQKKVYEWVGGILNNNFRQVVLIDEARATRDGQHVIDKKFSG